MNPYILKLLEIRQKAIVSLNQKLYLIQHNVDVKLMERLFATLICLIRFVNRARSIRPPTIVNTMAFQLRVLPTASIVV